MNIISYIILFTIFLFDMKIAKSKYIEKMKNKIITFIESLKINLLLDIGIIWTFILLVGYLTVIIITKNKHLNYPQLSIIFIILRINIFLYLNIKRY